MTGYRPIFYTPVIAPPPEIGPAPPIPFTDPATDYAVLTASQAVTVNPVTHAAMTITLSGAAHPRLLAMMGGCVAFVPRLGTYTLQNGARLPIDDAAVGSSAGTLVLEVWPADQLELGLLAGKEVRNVAYIAYENADPASVESAIAPLVAMAKDIEIESDSGLDPSTSPRPAIEAAFVTRFMAGEVSLFVRGGSVIGSAAATLSGAGGTETTLVFFDEGGCPDSSGAFLRALPLIGGNRWKDHPLIAALPPSVTDTPPFKAGFIEYEGPVFEHEEREYATKGIAYYPADADGENAPFASSAGAAPIVFVVHGNHWAYRKASDGTELPVLHTQKPYDSPGPIPSVGAQVLQQLTDGRWIPKGWLFVGGVAMAPGYVALPWKGLSQPGGSDEIRNDKGYIFLQEALARHGIISVSINCNLASWFSGPGNILLRARMIRSSIDYFLQGGASPVVKAAIDFTRVGLLGHSRGGEAVIAVADDPNAGIIIKSVLTLAPSDYGATDRTPGGYAFMTLLPAADSDVWPNFGAVFYDRAVAKPFKTQMYVHATNHNYFNREWKNPDNDNALLPVISRAEHERLLVAYSLPFFRFTLSGHAPSADVLSGTVKPSGAAACTVRLSFASDSQVVQKVDDFESGSASGVATDVIQVVAKLVRDPLKPQLLTTYYGETGILTVSTKAIHGTYRTPISPQSLHGLEVWLRAAEYYQPTASFPQTPTGFQVGIENAAGAIAWVDVDALGGLPRPYLRKVHDETYLKMADATKTMLETFRFAATRFVALEPTFDLNQVVAVILRFDRDDQREFLFDDLCIVNPGAPIQ